MKTMNYYQDDLRIFCGFYESHLYYSDMEYNLCEDGEELDFDAYTNDVSAAIVGELSGLLTDDPYIKDIRFVSLSSPRYYNFTTDKLNCEIDVEWEDLKKYVFEECYDEFDKYLKNNYSSRDGFISFVSNNISDFYNKDIDEYCSVLIDYYLLTLICATKDVCGDMFDIYETPYWQNILEDVVMDLFYNNLIKKDNDEVE